MIINCAIGGTFVDGPDESDVWDSSASVFRVDYVKVYDYLGGGRPVTSECRAKTESSDEELCEGSTWACEDQDYTEMDFSCNEEWRKCCKDLECTHDEVVTVVSDVYDEYDKKVTN